MIKIYFAKNWGLTSKQMCASYILQTPGNSGIWKNIQVTYDLDEADYLIIEDNSSLEEIKHFSNKKRIYFSREALDTTSHLKYTSKHFIRSTFWDNTGYLYTKWIYSTPSGGISMDYDTLKEEKAPEKTRLISTIQSNKIITKTHLDRINLVQKCSKAFKIDVFGSIGCANSTLVNNDKKNGLDPYQYCLAFDNQVTIENFFGTQFTDSLLRWTVPIYGGGAKLEKFFPPKSFIKIDPSNLNEVSRIKKILKEDNYLERFDAIEEARDLIMNKYNIWPTIKKIIDDQEVPK
jgi:hypothetical protein